MSESIPEPFDLEPRTAGRRDLPGQAWVYIKKLGEETATELGRAKGEIARYASEGQSEVLELSAVLGLTMFELEKALRRQRKRRRNPEELEHCIRWLTPRLRQAGITVDDPTGRELDERLYDTCEVESIAKRGAKTRVVGETLEPIIRVGDRIVHFGRVVAWVPESEVAQNTTE